MDSGMSGSDLLKLTNNLKKNPTFTSTRCQPNEPCYDTLLPTEQGWNIYSVIIVNVTYWFSCIDVSWCLQALSGATDEELTRVVFKATTHNRQKVYVLNKSSPPKSTLWQQRICLAEWSSNNYMKWSKVDVRYLAHYIKIGSKCVRWTTCRIVKGTYTEKNYYVIQ